VPKQDPTRDPASEARDDWAARERDARERQRERESEREEADEAGDPP